MLPRRRAALALAAAVLVVSIASAEVVNVDIEGSIKSDATHVGDNGPLSSAGGLLWKSVWGGTAVLNLPTEFGGATPFDMVYTGDAIPAIVKDRDASDLQDSGDFGAFEIRDLLPGETYTLAVYVGHNGGFVLTDDRGTDGYFFGLPEADGWGLPGTEGNGGDYFLVPDVEPMELSAGVWGVRVLPDGPITALQISGPVPEPTTGVLLTLAGLLALRRR